MTVAQLLSTISSTELTEWRLVFEIRAKDRAKAQRQRDNENR